MLTAGEDNLQAPLLQQADTVYGAPQCCSLPQRALLPAQVGILRAAPSYAVISAVMILEPQGVHCILHRAECSCLAPALCVFSACITACRVL